MRLLTTSFSLASLLIFSSAALAQQGDSSGLKTAEVTYAVGTQDRVGYMRASVTVNYKLIVCQGEVHLAYGLASTTPTVSENYNVGGGIGGTFVKATVPPPQLTTTTFKGGVTNGYTVLGVVEDEAAGKTLGYGCFTGQTKLMRPLKEVPGYRADMTPAEIAKLLDGYIIEPQALDRTLKNAQLAASGTDTEQGAPRASEFAAAISNPRDLRSASGFANLNNKREGSTEVDSGSPISEPSASVSDHLGRPPSQQTSTQPSPSAWFYCQIGSYLTSLQEVDVVNAMSLGQKIEADGVLGGRSLNNYMNQSRPILKWMALVYQDQILGQGGASPYALKLVTCNFTFTNPSSMYNRSVSTISSNGTVRIVDWKNPDGPYKLPIR